MSQGKYSKRMLAAAGSLAGLTVAQQMASQAALIHVNDRPVSIKMSDGDGASANWDIDGVGIAEYSLNVTASFFTYSATMTSSGLNGKGFVWAGGTNGDAMKVLSASFTVDAAAPWGAVGSRQLLSGSSSSVIGSDFADGGAVNGSNLIGFRFDAGAGMRYGYANFVFDVPGNGVTIQEWWYDDSGAGVHVEGAAPVPEPNTLALLALGAAGLASYRAARKKIAGTDNKAAAS